MSSQATIWEQQLSYWFLPLPLPQPFPIQNDPTSCSCQGHCECHLAVWERSSHQAWKALGFHSRRSVSRPPMKVWGCTQQTAQFLIQREKVTLNSRLSHELLFTCWTHVKVYLHRSTQVWLQGRVWGESHYSVINVIFSETSKIYQDSSEQWTLVLPDQ